MKSVKNHIKILLIILAALASIKNASAYVVGDYGSLSSGTWSSPIWGTWNGAGWTPIATFPSSSKNTFILTGTTVVLPAGGPWSCQDLTVETGGKLWTNNNGTPVYIYVYGFVLKCDGTIGDGANFDGISFGIEGTSCTVSGIGAFDAARIRKNLPPAATNFIIDMNINLHWNSASGTQLYNAAPNTLFNVTINAFRTVTLVPNGPNIGNVCIDGLDGTAGGLEAGGTFTINGTLIVSGKLWLNTNNASTAFNCNWIINGLVQANEIVAGGSTSAALHTLLINSGGKLDITGPLAFSTLNPTSVTNVATYSFQSGSTVEYSAAGNQTVRVKSEFSTTAAANQEYGNLIVSNTGTKSTLIPGASGHLYVKNDLTISGSSVLNPISTINIFVGGNWLNYNSTGFLEQTTTVYMNGAALQTISCPGGEVFNILRYAKSASFLQFNNPVDVISQLVFASAGYIDLNFNALTIRNSATTGISGASNTRFIVSEKTDNSSKVIWRINANTGTFTFPFGVIPGGAANYIPVIVSKTNPTNIGDLSIATYGTLPDNLPWPSTPTTVTNLNAYLGGIYNNPDNRHWTVDRYWEIGSTSPTPLNSVTLSYRAAELPDADPNPLNLSAQFWAGAFSVWNLIQYGTGNITNNVVVPTFSYFNTSWTLTSLTSPLPIELLNFEAVPEEKQVELKWTTASEINNDFFTVEKSIDGYKFFEIGVKDGAGNKTTATEYLLDDNDPFYGISYYRLKQTDFDGQFTYSKTIPVSCKKSKSHFSVFPNPTEDNAYVVSDQEINTEVFIRSIDGKILSHFINDGSKQVYPLAISGFSQGVYIVEIKSGNETQFLRLVKR